MPIQDPTTLRSLFHMAAAEVYALAAQGKKLDLTRYAHGGEYVPPTWIDTVKLCKTKTGKVSIGSRTQELCSHIENASLQSMLAEVEALEDPAAAIEQSKEVVEEVVVNAPKVAKAQKTFDFSANRTEPQAPQMEEVVLETKLEAVPEPESEVQQPVPIPLEKPAQALSNTRAEAPEETPLTQKHYETMYSGILLSDPKILFAVSYFPKISHTALTHPSSPNA
jgi:hypothetical protein